MRGLKILRNVFARESRRAAGFPYYQRMDTVADTLWGRYEMDFIPMPVDISDMGPLQSVGMDGVQRLTFMVGVSEVGGPDPIGGMP